MDARIRCSLRPIALLALAASLCTAAAGSAAAATDPLGAWQPHQLNFAYLGDISGTTYSCEGLTDALTFLLTQSGAKLNAPVRVIPCVHGVGRPSTMLTAELDFSTFQPAGADQVGQGPGLPGSWRPVVFSEPHSYPTLHFGDCELVSEFKEKVLTVFAIRDIQENLHCVPFQAAGGLYGLGFQTFVPTETPARAVGGG